MSAPILSDLGVDTAWKERTTMFSPSRLGSLARTWFAVVLPLALAAPGHAQDVVEEVITDAFGNIRVILDERGNVLERHDYLPFGEECTTGPCASNPGGGAGQSRKFTGKERDPETGLDYFGARYHNAPTGRFTTVDPVYTWNENLLDPQRWNRYAYAGALIIVAANVDMLGDIGQAVIESGALKATQPGYPGLDIGMDRKMSGYLFNKSRDTGSTLSPGPHAGESIPARGPQRDFKPGERADVNEIGGTEGCHTCGKTIPGTKSGNFVPDHQPPTAVNKTNAPQRLYPQCIDCSRKQGGEVSAAVRKEKE